jgi:hypothetical protein
MQTAVFLDLFVESFDNWMCRWVSGYDELGSEFTVCSPSFQKSATDGVGVFRVKV